MLLCGRLHAAVCFFFLNDTATTEISPLPLHDALPICPQTVALTGSGTAPGAGLAPTSLGFGNQLLSTASTPIDRKSTRLNSSHGYISYAVFCLKKKKITSMARPRPTRS